MDTATQLLPGELSEPPFDLIDLRRRRWREESVHDLAMLAHPPLTRLGQGHRDGVFVHISKLKRADRPRSWPFCRSLY